MRISDWSSDVCSSDLSVKPAQGPCSARRAAETASSTAAASPSCTRLVTMRVVGSRFSNSGRDEARGRPSMKWVMTGRPGSGAAAGVMGSIPSRDELNLRNFVTAVRRKRGAGDSFGKQVERIKTKKQENSELTE